MISDFERMKIENNELKEKIKKKELVISEQKMKTEIMVHQYTDSQSDLES